MRLIRFLLFPLAVLYGWVMAARNALYDHGLLASRSFPVPLIGVGNLTVGGTGKTPHVEYLLRLLQGRNLATLSRGYGRKTKGFLLADEGASSSSLGDEPFQYHLDFPGVSVAVSEDRVKGVECLLKLHPETEVVLLDDAYQHRPVHPHLNLLITDYGRLFYRDYVLPAGLLREHRSGAERADAVIVSKCPAKLRPQEMDQIASEAKSYGKEKIQVFFSSYHYGDPIAFGGAAVCEPRLVMLTGIANPAPMKDYLVQAGYSVVEQIRYRDHHSYSHEDLAKLKNKVAAYQGERLSVITTRKDAVRLLDPAFQSWREGMPLFYLPIEVAFLRDQESFDQLILSQVEGISHGQLL